MSILCVNLNHIKLEGANLYEDDLKTIIYIRSLAWHHNLKQHKTFKKELSKKLMPLAWRGIGAYQKIRKRESFY